MLCGVVAVVVATAALGMRVTPANLVWIRFANCKHWNMLFAPQIIVHISSVIHNAHTSGAGIFYLAYVCGAPPDANLVLQTCYRHIIREWLDGQAMWVDVCDSQAHSHCNFPSYFVCLFSSSFVLCCSDARCGFIATDEGFESRKAEPNAQRKSMLERYCANFYHTPMLLRIAVYTNFFYFSMRALDWKVWCELEQ